MTVAGQQGSSTITGTLVADIAPPTLSDMVTPTGLLRARGKMTISTDGGGYLTVPSDGVVSTTGQQSDASLFTSGVDGGQIMFVTGSGQKLYVESDGTLRAGSSAHAAKFTINATCLGFAAFSDASSRYWNVQSGGGITLASDSTWARCSRNAKARAVVLKARDVLLAGSADEQHRAG